MKQSRAAFQPGLLRGACHRAGHFGPDPLAHNDEIQLVRAIRPRHPQSRHSHERRRCCRLLPDRHRQSGPRRPQSDPRHSDGRACPAQCRPARWHRRRRSGRCRSRLRLTGRRDRPPWETTNVIGGAIALGHPYGMSGIRYLGQTLMELGRRDAHRAVIGVCTAGGMATAAYLER
jgi:hypothetical protein